MTSKRFVHIRWGGVFEIDRGTLVSIIHEPLRWKLMEAMGWEIGMTIPEWIDHFVEYVPLLYDVTEFDSYDDAITNHGDDQ